MSAPGIIYSGVLAKKVASDHPVVGVFSGLRFWVSVRVPQRKGCVELIEVQDMTVFFLVNNQALTYLRKMAVQSF